MSTVIQLITDALYLSGVVALEFDTPNATQESVGLRLLNGILSTTAISASMIPYNTIYSLSAVIGQQIYPVNNLIQLQTFTFFLPGNVRFEMREDSTYKFWGTCRAENIQSLPYHFYVKRRVGGSDLYLYFLPDQAYPMQIVGKFALTNASINDELDNSYDGFYQQWLKYKLASWLAQQYNITLNPDVRKDLEKMTSDIFDLVGIDLTMRKISLTDRKDAPGFWGYVNFSRGWIP